MEDKKLLNYLISVLVGLFLVYANGKYQKAIGFSEGLEDGRNLYAVDRAEIVKAISEKYEAQNEVYEYEIKELQKQRVTELLDNSKLSELDQLRSINELLRQP